MPELTPGRYRAELTSIAVRPSTRSRAVMLNCTFFIHEQWDGAVWNSVFSDSLQVEGNYCIVKANGSRFTGGIKSFANATGWNGDVRQLQPNSGFKPNKIQIEVQAETYEEKTRMRAAWIHSYESDPNVRSGPAQGICGDELEGLAATLGNLLEPEPTPPAQSNVFDALKPDNIPF